MGDALALTLALPVPLGDTPAGSEAVGLTLIVVLPLTVGPIEVVHTLPRPLLGAHGAHGVDEENGGEPGQNQNQGQYREYGNQQRFGGHLRSLRNMNPVAAAKNVGDNRYRFK